MLGQQLLVWFITTGRRDHQIEIKALRGIDVRVAHVVAITDPHHFFALDRTAMLNKGHDISEQLARVIGVG